MKFDNEEESLLRDYENGKIKVRKPTSNELQTIVLMGKKTLRKDVLKRER